MSVDIEIQIKEYFCKEPIDRLSYYKSLAAQVVTVDSVILILDWGADGTRTIEDAWGGAVDILSEVDDVLLQVLESKALTQWKRGGLGLDVRMHRVITILAEGIAVASKLHPYLRVTGALNCWSELKKYNSYEQTKNNAKVVSAIIRAIEISDLNDLKDYLVPLLVESKTDERLDLLHRLMSH